MSRLNIHLLDPFHTGSHRQWSLGWQRNSQHRITLQSLPGRHWKWRMFGAAPYLAAQLPAEPPDLLVTTDMLDLSTYLGLSRSFYQGVPSILYFHENQITYPWSETDRKVADARNLQYGFLNFTAALAADALWFNSDYHRQSFLEGAESLLKKFPRPSLSFRLEELHAKAQVRYLGMELSFPAKAKRADNTPPVILWNHRHEYDKDPEAFFAALRALRRSKTDFRLVVLGEQYRSSPAIFGEARREFDRELLHWGYTESVADYRAWLQRADLLYVTAQQDFFGGSTVEALAAGVIPILPDRLAYPEHLPPEFQKELLYDTPERGHALLTNFCRHPEHLQRFARLRDFVRQRYDWSVVAPLYDAEARNLSINLSN